MAFGEWFADELLRRISFPSDSVRRERGIPCDSVVKTGGLSEPFPLKLHSLLLEGVFMVDILSLKGD